MSSRCSKCTALCCRYVALEMDRPETKRDFEDIRWYVAHRGVQVFVAEGRWYIEFRTRCKYLTKDNRCAIYEKRPAICREHDPNTCEFDGPPNYQVVLRTPDEVDEYYREWIKLRRRLRRRFKDVK